MKIFRTRDQYIIIKSFSLSPYTHFHSSFHHPPLILLSSIVVYTSNPFFLFFFFEEKIEFLSTDLADLESILDCSINYSKGIETRRRIRATVGNCHREETWKPIYVCPTIYVGYNNNAADPSIRPRAVDGLIGNNTANR